MPAVRRLPSFGAHRRTAGRGVGRSVTVGVAAAAVVAGTTTAVLAAPASPPTAEVVMNESLTPVLHGEATTAGTGAESVKFWARTVGAASWDLLNGYTEPGRSATKRITASGLGIGEAFEYQIAHCDDGGCTASDVRTGHVSPDLAAGERPGSTQLPFTVGDGIDAQVDVGTGNLFVSATQMTLPRVTGSLDIGLAYNSLTLAPGSRFESSISPGWRFFPASDLRAEENTGASVTVYGPDGLTGTFISKTGSTTEYESPRTMKATLLALAPGGSTGWDLTWHETGEVWRFSAGGRLISIRDRNGENNVSQFTYNSTSTLTQIQNDVGPYTARTVQVASDSSGRITGLSQSPSGATPRSVTYTYANDRLSSIIDVLGRTTTFGYNAAGDLTSITAPGGAETTFTYDSAHRVTAVSQPSAGTARAIRKVSSRLRQDRVSCSG